MTIKKSLQSSMIVTASVPIILFAILSIWISVSQYISVSKGAIQNTAVKYQKGFESQLNTQIVELESLANNNEIISVLLKKYNAPETDLVQETTSRESITKALTQIANSFGNNVCYSIYDLTGTLIYSSSPKLVGTTNAYIDEVAEDLSRTTVNTDGVLHGMNNSISIITPISVKDKYQIGIAVASINEEYFGNFISTEDNSYILDIHSNYLLGIPLDDPEISHDAIVLLSQYDGDAQMRSGTIYHHDLFTMKLYGYSIMPEYKWIYITEQNNDIYASLITSMPIVIVAVLVAFFICTYLISSSLAKRFTKPIYHLKNKMSLASLGNLDVQCDIDENNEFGELASHFNDMMDIISSNYDEINETKQQLEESRAQLQENYDQIEKLAFTDTLTGLANRVAFMTKTHALFHQNGGFVKRAIFFLDLDNFKNVNDTLGHDYGDLLLQQISEKLSLYMEPEDILARTGGDEFLVLKANAESIDELDEFASKLVTTASEPFELDGEIAKISMSVGIAIFPQNGLTVNELIKNADIAMYSAKNAGKNSYRFFNSSMEDELNHKNDIEDILHHAIEQREVYLVYQPQCNIQSGRITGCEALMRLRNGYLGQISPGEFIPIAEECGAIHELGIWALKQACGFNKQLLDNGFGPLTMSVNVSIEQLKAKDFVKQVKEVLVDTKLPPNLLELEVTESVLMQSFKSNLQILQELRDMGIRIALDDFGTGYSSFNYLTQMPIDTLKIDKSFIDNIDEDEKDAYIAETIIHLAHRLGISVVAEGVEVSKQLNLLTDYHCDTLQGYLFSKPLPDEHYRNLLEINLDSNESDDSN